MMMERRRLRGFRLLLMVVATAVVAVPAVPAAAEPAPPAGEPAGAGSLEGTEAVEEWDWSGNGICIAATKTIYALGGIGTYEGRAATGEEVVYRAELDDPNQTLYGDGPIKVEVENPEPYYYGPFGTHGTTDSSCAPATTGTPIAADFRIFAADHIYKLDGAGAQVPCLGTGTFSRGVQNQTTQPYTHQWHSEWTLSEDCTVVGNAAGTPGTGTAPPQTAHTHAGVHEPCFSGACVNNFRVDYHQYLPYAGLHVGVSGPATATVATPVAVSAAVAVDGVPLANAPVTFSVSGPTPSQPPGGAAVTGADGRASFTFTSATAGDYTVTASVTNAGTTATGTHLVRFSVPPPTVTIDGPTKGQTEDAQTVTATFTNAGNPTPGATVSFAVAGPGQATPASGSALTDNNGKASFTFAADRAGTYTVSATATFTGQSSSATHPVRLDVKSFSLAGSLQARSSFEEDAAVVDPAGDYAYFGADGNLEKIDLRTFQVVATHIPQTFPVNEFEGRLTSGVMDPAGRYAYFGTTTATGPARVLKFDLATFQRVGVIALEPGEEDLKSAVIDPAGAYAYFGTADTASGATGRVVKIDLATFSRVGAITFPAGEEDAKTAVIDPAGRYAYFSAEGGGANPAHVVKVDLATFSRVEAITLNGSPERYLGSAVIDPKGDYAYFGTVVDPGAGRVIRVDLNTFARDGALVLEPFEEELQSAAIDPTGRAAYFGTAPSPNGPGQFPPNPSVVKVDLDTFERDYAVYLPASDQGQLQAAVIDPAGSFAYFKQKETPAPNPPSPAKVHRFAVSRPPVAWLAAGNDSYTTPPARPLSVAAPGVLANDADTGDGDPLTATLVGLPSHGDVSLNPDGSFSYSPDAGFSGTDSFTYRASDGMDYSAPATVSVAVAPPQGPTGSAYGFSSSVSLFGGPAEPRGPSPSVTLPETGSVAPITATAPQGDAVYGPAKIFTSGQLDVSTQGTTASVTSSATVANVNRSLDEKFTAANVTSTCTATASGVSGSATITSGVLEVSEGDPNVDGDETYVTIPSDPLPNTAYEGQLESVGDHFRYVFNEQVRNPDGSITIYAAHQYLLGPTAIGDLYIGKSECGVPQIAVAELGAVADFDGDGATDVSVFRPSTGVWYLRQSTDGDRAVEFGADGDVPVPGDYDGDGTTDLGVYRPSNGVWYLRQTSGGDSASQFGAAGDVPVPGDYDGDGATDLGVYRPSTGVWYLRQSTGGDRATQFGAGGDVAVPGDYDGDGTSDLGVFRPSTGVWYARQSTDGDRSSAFGIDGDVPVPGDYDDDGTTDVGVYRPSTGTWYLRRSTEGDTASSFGVTGDLPVPGDYDGDGTTDLGVHRPEGNVWYLRRSTTGDTATQFGAPGDIPLALPAAIRQSAP